MGFYPVHENGKTSFVYLGLIRREGEVDAVSLECYHYFTDCSMIPPQVFRKRFIHTVDSSERDHGLIIMLMAEKYDYLHAGDNSETLFI